MVFYVGNREFLVEKPMEKVWNIDFLYFNERVKISLEFRTEKLQSGHKISDFIDQKFPLQNQFLGYFPPCFRPGKAIPGNSIFRLEIFPSIEFRGGFLISLLNIKPK